jgi:hypothetical protein
VSLVLIGRTRHSRVVADARLSNPAQFALLLDTNAFIALEPTSPSPEAGLADAAELVRLAQQYDHRFFLSAATDKDIAGDPNAARRTTNRALSRKYQKLEPIDPPPDLLAALGETRPPAGRDSNDDIDLEMLAALWADAVDFLVTDDERLRRRGARAGLGERILRIVEAAALLQRLAPSAALPPPAVDALRTYQLDVGDPIFDSLREDYDFDPWLAKIRQAPGRPAWVIKMDDGSYGAVMIAKDEQPGTLEMPGKILKLSTLKVAEHAYGRSFGELLLKTLFVHADHGAFDTVYVTAFPKQDRLIEMLDDFGFVEHPERVGVGEELVLVKYRRPVDTTIVDPLTSHRVHGPPYIHPASRVFVVPVQPRWHDALFPDAQGGFGFWGGATPHGNALRKAYVSGTRSRRIGSGDTVLFYRSKDTQEVGVVGVVEDVRVSSDPEVIRRFVGRRTVYRPDQIAAMARKHGTLHAMIFRQDRLIDRPWTLRQLLFHGVLNDAPQTITEAREGGAPWVHQQLVESQ